MADLRTGGVVDAQLDALWDAVEADAELVRLMGMCASGDIYRRLVGGKLCHDDELALCVSEHQVLKDIRLEPKQLPYVKPLSSAITLRLWLLVDSLGSLTEGEYIALWVKTQTGVDKLKMIFDQVGDDFQAVMDYMTTEEARESGLKLLPVDELGYPDIEQFTYGCFRPTAAQGLYGTCHVGDRCGVRRWHQLEDNPAMLVGLQVTDGEGRVFKVVPYGCMNPWDKFHVLASMCDLGYEQTIQRALDRGFTVGKIHGDLSQVAVINYQSLQEGIRIGYSAACAAVDDMFMAEIVKDHPQYYLHYAPKRNVWGPTIDLTLDREAIGKWREAGGTPVQLKRLRGAVYTLLRSEENVEEIKEHYITVSLGQLERVLWNDPGHHVTDRERALINDSFELLSRTHIECTYPAIDKGVRHRGIDPQFLEIHGMTLFPAVWANRVDAKGNIVDAAFRFHALPPLDAQADEINHSYVVPYLNGTARLPRAGAKVESTTYDVETVLAGYMRMAKRRGSANVYIDTLAREVAPDTYRRLAQEVAIAEGNIRAGVEVAESKRVKGAKQHSVRKLRARVKRDAIKCLRVLVEHEAVRDNAPAYFSVIPLDGPDDGFAIRRVRPTAEQRKAKVRPHTVFTYGR